MSVKKQDILSSQTGDLDPRFIYKRKTEIKTTLESQDFSQISQSDNGESQASKMGAPKKNKRDFKFSQAGLIQDASQILSECNSILTLLDKVKNRIQFTVEEISKRVSDLLKKYQNLFLPPNMVKDQQPKTIKQEQYSEYTLKKHCLSIVDFKTSLGEYREQLQKILYIKQQSDARSQKVADKQQIQSVSASAVEVKINQTLNNYDKMVAQVNGNIIVLSSLEQNYTDVYQIQFDNGHSILNFTHLLTLDQKVNFVQYQENRLILDTFIYKISNGSYQRQVLPLIKLSGCLAMKKDLLIYTFLMYTKYAIYKFNGNQYQILTKGYFMCQCGTHAPYSIYNMKIDSSDDDYFYSIVYKRYFYKIKLSVDKGKAMLKLGYDRNFDMKWQSILDFQQLNHTKGIFILLYTSSAVIYNEKTDSLLSIYDQIMEPQLQLIVTPMFDMKENPFIITQEQNGLMMENIVRKGFYGLINGCEEFTAIGQIQLKDDQTLVIGYYKNYYGKVAVLEISQNNKKK